MASLIAQNVGAASAKHLFSVVGAYGVTGLRLALAALLLLAFRRPWRRWPSRTMLPALIAYGMMLGLMNLLIYKPSLAFGSASRPASRCWGRY